MLRACTLTSTRSTTRRSHAALRPPARESIRPPRRRSAGGSRRVRLYGLRHLRDPHAAHDLVQQVLLMTLERLRGGRLREPDRIVSFVLGMCRMVVLEIRRGSWRRENLLATYGDTAEAVEPPEAFVVDDADRLAACLQALAERERTVVVLSFFAEQSGDEVAKELDVSAGNVRVIRHRALARLRACMGEVGR